MKLFRSLGVVAGLTLISNLLGYIRDLALASNFGATNVTDAYFAAFLVPNTLYLILLSGSVATIFLPIFIQTWRRNHEEAWSLASSVFNLSLLALIVTVLLAIVSIRFWFPLFFPGFDSATSQLAQQLSIVLLPMLIFIGLASLAAAVLNSFEHFTIPAVAPILGNLIVIIAIFTFHTHDGIYAVALAVTFSMLAQLLIQFPLLLKKGAVYHPMIDWQNPALRNVLKLSVPLIFYLFVAYASVFLERNLASRLGVGALSAFNYAVRIFSIPVGIFAGSIGTVIYPKLSLEIVDDHREGFSDNLLKAVGATLFILMPLSIWLGINSESVIRLLFGYGKFSGEDIHLTALVLRGYVFGMAGTGLARILQRAFYAMQDTSVPLFVELINLVVYAGMATLFTRLYGIFGLAFARGTSFVIVFIISLLAFRIKYSTFLLSHQKIIQVIVRYILASIPTVLVWLFSLWMLNNIAILIPGRLGEFIYLVVSGAIGWALFLGVAGLLKIEELAFVRLNLRNLKAFVTNQA